MPGRVTLRGLYLASFCSRVLYDIGWVLICTRQSEEGENEKLSEKPKARCTIYLHNYNAICQHKSFPENIVM